jgi:hypothetical protein
MKKKGRKIDKEEKEYVEIGEEIKRVEKKEKELEMKMKITEKKEKSKECGGKAKRMNKEDTDKDKEKEKEIEKERVEEGHDKENELGKEDKEGRKEEEYSEKQECEKEEKDCSDGGLEEIMKLDDVDRLRKEIKNEIEQMKKLKKEVGQSLNRIIPYKIWGNAEEVKKLRENREEVIRLKKIFFKARDCINKHKGDLEIVEKEKETITNENEKELSHLHYQLVRLQWKENVKRIEIMIKNEIKTEKEERIIHGIGEEIKRVEKNEREIRAKMMIEERRKISQDRKSVV